MYCYTSHDRDSTLVLILTSLFWRHHVICVLSYLDMTFYTIVQAVSDEPIVSYFAMSIPNISQEVYFIFLVWHNLLLFQHVIDGLTLESGRDLMQVKCLGNGKSLLWYWVIFDQLDWISDSGIAGCIIWRMILPPRYHLCSESSYNSMKRTSLGRTSSTFLTARWDRRLSHGTQVTRRIDVAV